MGRPPIMMAPSTNGSFADDTFRGLVIADGRELVRSAIRNAAEARGGLLVLGEESTADRLLTTAKRTLPDVILLDAELPRNGCTLSWLIRRRPPKSRVLVLAREHDMGLLVESIRAGASGFVTEHRSVDEVIEAIRSVLRGEAIVPPSMLPRLLRHLLDGQGEDDDRNRLGRLTERERQVLTLLVGGANTKAIARMLVISPRTVRTHVQRILAKLEVHSQTEAAAYAARRGIRPEPMRVAG
jgi:DNA-binding NarL/FixJ family response regulator